MVAFIPLYAFLTQSDIHLQDHWLWILLGILTSVRIAEETLFRGFVFNFLRRDRPFWRAATPSMIFFGIISQQPDQRRGFCCLVGEVQNE